MDEDPFGLAADMQSLSGWEPQHTSNIAQSHAAARTRSTLVISFVAREALMHVPRFGHVDCAISAWSFAALMVWNGSLMAAAISRCVGLMDQLDAQNLCNLAQTSATFSYVDAALLRETSERSMLKVMQPSPQELANTRRKFVESDVMTKSLSSAPSSAVLLRAEQMQGQALCSLADASLPCQDQLMHYLLGFVNKFIEVWSPNQLWDAGCAARAVMVFEVDSLGLHGSRILCDKIGIPEASPSFILRATAKISQKLAEVAVVPQSALCRRRPRILAYAEYHFEGAQTRRGSFLLENGLQEGRVADSRPTFPSGGG
ncbi:unnamed protein product [Symbiodinium pilosum]|uniref:Uncharacterized protein n=1 Tax=Symbiodinium pilosum TaxID=2952 RepID=A0A812QAV9_SYMPI|nr:unnamed protein product [Symbiodinium pilosum]